MPSEAYMNFNGYLITDVDRLIQAHAVLSPPGHGRRALGHITRSAVTTLCAAWEVFLEELLLDVVAIFVNAAGLPSELPDNLKRALIKHINKKDQHDFKPLDLAGEGWRGILREMAQKHVDNFHTPRTRRAVDMFKEVLGVEDVSVFWSRDVAEVDGFVDARCEIAHRGAAAPYIRINDIHWYRQLIVQTARDTDRGVAEWVRDHGPHSRLPWVRRYE